LYVGVGVPLETTVLNRNGSTSCIGDTVNYTCTVGGIAHVWRIAPPGSSATTGVITRVSPTFSFPGGAPSPFMISIATYDMVNNVITTVLTVTSFAGLNGTDILCIDGTVVNGEIQETIATVLTFGELTCISYMFCGSKYYMEVLSQHSVSLHCNAV
jgi:hypothetical protein